MKMGKIYIYINDAILCRRFCWSLKPNWSFPFHCTTFANFVSNVRFNGENFFLKGIFVPKSNLWFFMFFVRLFGSIVFLCESKKLPVRLMATIAKWHSYLGNCHSFLLSLCCLFIVCQPESLSILSPFFYEFYMFSYK